MVFEVSLILYISSITSVAAFIDQFSEMYFSLLCSFAKANHEKTGRHSMVFHKNLLSMCDLLAFLPPGFGEEHTLLSICRTINIRSLEILIYIYL